MMESGDQSGLVHFLVNLSDVEIRFRVRHALAAIGMALLLLAVNWFVQLMRRTFFRKHRRRQHIAGGQQQGDKHITGTQFLKAAQEVGTEGVFGLDIGGTLAKVVYLAPFKSSSNSITTCALYGDTGERNQDLEFDCEVMGGTLHFIRFESRSVDTGVQNWPKISSKALDAPPLRLYATGGGAFKYSCCLQRGQGLDFHKVDELESMVVGFRTLLKHGPKEEIFRICLRNDNAKIDHVEKPISKIDPRLPSIVVNIGSGVSIMKLHNRKFERIGGTSAGGATFLGLCRLLTDADTFEEAMGLCTLGDAKNVDKLVRDIYGGDYENFGLPGDLCASSLGKVATMTDPKRNAKKEDLALGILTLITQQITLLAINLAKVHNCKERVFFVGGFLRYNDIAKRLIASASDCQGVTAHFLRHADYLGAVGALVRSLDELGRVATEDGSVMTGRLPQLARTVAPFVSKLFPSNDPDYEESPHTHMAPLSPIYPICTPGIAPIRKQRSQSAQPR